MPPMELYMIKSNLALVNSAKDSSEGTSETYVKLSVIFTLKTLCTEI